MKKNTKSTDTFVNTTMIEKALKRASMNVATLVDATGLSVDQIRRALKSMDVEWEKVGRSKVYSMKKRSKKNSGEKKTAGRKPSVSSVARELIVAGKTNEEVMEALVEQFGIDAEAKRHYAGWYRAECVRTGLITKKFAKDNAHAEGWTRRNAKGA